MFTLRHRCFGIILLEVMSALLLSSIIILAFTEIYLSFQRNFHLQSAINTISDNANKTIAILSNEIRKAGHIGCLYLDENIKVESDSLYTLSYSDKIKGDDSSLTVRYMDSLPNNLLSLSTDKTMLSVDRATHFKSGDDLIISDCQHAEIFKIKKIWTSARLSKITTYQALHHSYQENAEVAKLQINHYFIDKNDAGGFSLYVENSKKRKIELVEGVSRMRVIYSILNKNKLEEVTAIEGTEPMILVGVAIDFDVTAFSIKKTWHMYVAL